MNPEPSAQFPALGYLVAVARNCHCLVDQGHNPVVEPGVLRAASQDLQDARAIAQETVALRGVVAQADQLFRMIEEEYGEFPWDSTGDRFDQAVRTYRTLKDEAKIP